MDTANPSDEEVENLSRMIEQKTEGRIKSTQLNKIQQECDTSIREQAESRHPAEARISSGERKEEQPVLSIDH